MKYVTDIIIRKPKTDNLNLMTGVDAAEPRYK